MSEFLLTNAWLCQIEPDGISPVFCDLEVADGRIARITPAGTLRTRGEGMDVAGRVITAPLVNFHEHAYSRLAKGLAVTAESSNLVEILENLWWRLDRALDADMIRASAELTAMESVTCGVGYVFDHHSSPSFIAGSLSILSEVFQEYGLRSVLCYETSDRNGPQSANAALTENERLAAMASNDVRAMLGLHAPFTLSDETLTGAARVQERTGLAIHSHLAEDTHENIFSRERFGKSPVERLLAHGLLNEPAIVAHAVHLSDGDRARLAQTGAGVACCPDSNLNNGVGLVPLRDLPETTPVLAGTDGMHANIARTLKQLFLLYRHQGGMIAEALGWFEKVLREQFQFARRYFPDYPSLHVGERADLVVWDYVPPAPLTRESSLGHFVYGVLEGRARTLIVGGRSLMRDFILCIPDETRRRSMIAEQGARLHQRFAEMFPS